MRTSLFVLVLAAGCSASHGTSVCEPGATESCTSPLCAPCHVGTQTCLPDGSGWDTCQVSCGPPCDAGPPVDANAADASPCIGAGLVVPNAQRACATDADCAIAAHQSDCCGTLEAHGIRADALSGFTTTETACRAMFPACGCDSGRVTTDDGAAAPAGTGTSGVAVTCDAGLCTTHVRCIGC